MWLLVDAKAGSNIKHEIIHSDHGRATTNLTLSSPKSIRDRNFASHKTSSSQEHQSIYYTKASSVMQINLYDIDICIEPISNMLNFRLSIKLQMYIARQ